MYRINSSVLDQRLAGVTDPAEAFRIEQAWAAVIRQMEDILLRLEECEDLARNAYSSQGGAEDDPQYFRVEENFSEVVNAEIARQNIGAIGEAPIDGTPYSRQDAGWVASSAGLTPTLILSNQSSAGGSTELSHSIPFAATYAQIYFVAYVSITESPGIMGTITIDPGTSNYVYDYTLGGSPGGGIGGASAYPVWATTGGTTTTSFSNLAIQNYLYSAVNETLTVRVKHSGANFVVGAITSQGGGFNVNVETHGLYWS